MRIKGRERRKSQRAKIFGKENKRRTKNGRRRVFRVMNNYSNAIVFFLSKVNVPKNKKRDWLKIIEIRHPSGCLK